MRLVYKETKEEVQVYDRIFIDGEGYVVEYFAPPHKASSSGKVTLRKPGTTNMREYYVSVIGAEWIEREDRL